MPANRMIKCSSTGTSQRILEIKKLNFTLPKQDLFEVLGHSFFKLNKKKEIKIEISISDCNKFISQN